MNPNDTDDLLSQPTVPQLGVEEEYQLVDPSTGRLVPACHEVMAEIRGRSGKQDVESEIVHELHLNQIEMASPVCDTLDDARRNITDTRRVIAAAADQTGVRMMSAATNPLPLPEEDDITKKNRYVAMTERYQQLATDLYIFGCHVHVSMPDRDLGVAVINRCRQWLPLLQTFTANSPYWDGRDTGYDSYRRELWMQWPMAGAPPAFEDAAAYDRCVNQLVDATAINDASNVYWDIRLPDKVPTIEFRAADAMCTIDETIGYTGLVRAMVMAAVEDQRRGVKMPEPNDHVIRYAIWFAARYGVEDRTIDPVAGRPTKLQSRVDELWQWIHPSLDISGDTEIVRQFIDSVLRYGNGAKRQRQASGYQSDDPYDQPGDENLRKVVRWAIDQTAPLAENPH